jgi:hypothetical protein
MYYEPELLFCSIALRSRVMVQSSDFDPGKYLTKVGHSDYLEVKWRLVWLREAHPDAVIETELVSHSDQMAIFRARVAIPGGGSATGYGSEGYDDFREYIEKAETKALGRALAALGFGTQFCPDFEFGAGNGKVVDSPIDFSSTRGRRMTQQPAQRGDRGVANLNQPATSRQISFVQAIARELGLADADLEQELMEQFGKPLADLERREASAMIERLQGRRSGALATDLAS